MMLRLLPFLLALSLLVTASAAATLYPSGDGLAVSIDESTFAYSILLDSSPWLSSGAIAVSSNSRWLSSANLGLTLASVDHAAGSDTYLGPYTSVKASWNSTTTSSAILATEILIFTYAPAVLFRQIFPSGIANATSGGNNEAASVFPSFATNTTSSGGLNYLTFYGLFSVPKNGHWPDKNYPGGAEGGLPLVLYNSALRTVVVSPHNNFLVATQTNTPSFPNQLSVGLLGTIQTIPANFVHETILWADRGIRTALFEWGGVLLFHNGKKRTTLDADLAISHLGYWTDNGAYYYYTTEPGINYQQTLIDVAAHLNASGIPIQYLQFDSWWYYKGINDGVTLWEPVPSVFPSQLDPFLPGNLPVALHNRYFAPDNQYKSQYSMICEDYACLPLDQKLFEHLMERVKPWGTFLYEQDWLINTYLNLSSTRNNVSNAITWLQAMGNAATSQGMTIQYCMPLPNFHLASVMIPSVTQARASDDYRPSFRQWDIGPSSMLIWSLGVVPFKDDFWTNSTQPGCKSTYPACFEPQPHLQALAAVLSAGPVGPSDRIGYEDKDIILRTCRSGDGLLLKPDRPAFPLDSTYANAFATAAPVNIIETVVAYPENSWHYVLATELTAEYQVLLSDLGESPLTTLYAFDYFGANLSFALVDETHPLRVTTASSDADAAGGASGPVPMRYVVLAPLWKRSGWVFLGELGKYVTVSKQRVIQVADASDALQVSWTGTAGELCAFTFYHAASNKVSTVSCRATAGAVSVVQCDKSSCRCN